MLYFILMLYLPHTITKTGRTKTTKFNLNNFRDIKGFDYEKLFLNGDLNFVLLDFVVPNPFPLCIIKYKY